MCKALGSITSREDKEKTNKKCKIAYPAKGMQGQLNWPMAPSCEKPLPSFYSSGSLK
jgi:hypothetical protein